jgi:hypothetical protein
MKFAVLGGLEPLLKNLQTAAITRTSARAAMR